MSTPMSTWQTYPPETKHLAGVSYIDDDELPSVFAWPDRGEVGIADWGFTPDQARRFAAYLIEGAAIVERRVKVDES